MAIGFIEREEFENIRRLKLEEIDISANLFDDFTEILKLCSLIPTLEFLRAK